MDAVDDDEMMGESEEHIPTHKFKNFENHKSKHSYKQKAGNNNQENEPVKHNESQTTKDVPKANNHKAENNATIGTNIHKIQKESIHHEGN